MEHSVCLPALTAAADLVMDRPSIRPSLANDSTATEISRIENGQRDVQVSTIFKLAKAFDLTPGQFIDGDLTTTTKSDVSVEPNLIAGIDRLFVMGDPVLP
jgi:transcriptional regulator with XRE-family HTH domain